MADRVDYFFRERVTEAELDLGFELLERADRNLAADLGFVGVLANAAVSQHAPVPDLTVDVSGPASILDQAGERIFFSSLQNVDVAQDSSGVSTAVAAAGNEKIVSVFAKFDRALSDPRIDGNSLTVFFRRDESFRFVVAQGGEAPAGIALPPPLRSDAILLADVVRRFDQAQILNADISIARRQDAFVVDGTPRSIRRGRPIEAISDLLAFVNAHAGGTTDRHPASAIDFAGAGAWADGTTNPPATVEEQIDKIVADLAATTGAPKVGAAATAGAPLSLVAGSVKSQVDALLGYLDAHIASGPAHAAGVISYAGGGTWADGTPNPATTVEVQLDKLISDLAAATGAPKVGAAATAGTPTSLPAGTVKSQVDALLAAVNARVVSTDLASQALPGAGLVGADAVSGTPDSLSAGTVDAQLATLLAVANSRARKSGEVFTGPIVPSTTGLDLGSATARWDAFLRDLDATGSVTAPTFLPQHAGSVPDTVPITGVTQRNIVKAWGSVTATGVLNDPHWNVASVAHPGTGRYSITLDVSPGTRSAVVAAASSAALSADFSLHVFSPDGISFEVDINSAGALTDNAFTFVAVGG
jgi:hypothetical protein